MATVPYSKPIENVELIALAQSGDSDACGKLCELYYRKAYMICLRMVKNPDDAEDLAQESCIQLLRKIKTFRGDAQFGTWFHTIVRNVVLMKLRASEGRLRSRTISLEEILDPEEPDGPRREIPAEDNHLRSTIARITLRRAIEQLPPGYQLIFKLHDIEGLEHNEIADLLQCSIGNCKSQLHKARQRLMRILGVTADPFAILANFDRFIASEEPPPQPQEDA